MSLDDFFGDERLDLSEVLSHVLDKGVVLKGEVMLAVADIDLVRLDLGLLLTGVATVLEKRRREERRHLPDASGPSEVAATTASGSTMESQVAPSGSTMESQVADSLEAPRSVPVTPLEAVAEGLPPRLNTDPDKVENGLARLVLTLIEVLRKVLEHQAVRRMEGGHL
ncbi:MAG: gas vesicle protein GvpJ, partial [Gemmatimonadaceae bacterium]